MGKGAKQEAKPKQGLNRKAAPQESKLETVWQINGKQYDLNKFGHLHPGGHRAIMNAAAHPHGELFVESYHPDPDLIYGTIEKYEIRGTPEVTHPVNKLFEGHMNYSFEDNDFYRKVKKAGMLALRGKQKGRKATRANLRGSDVYLLVDIFHLVALALTTLLLCLGSWKAAIVTGILRGACIMRIAHVGSHASLSPYPEFNAIMYYIAMVFSGTTPEIWSRKHVVRHHVNTNEDVLDEDRMEDLKSVFERAPWHAFHKDQHVYMWPFYTHVTFVWTFSDLIFNSTRKNAGPLPYSVKDIVLNYLTMGSHILITYVLPIYLCGWLWGLFLIELNTLLASIIFGFEFIVNHEIDGCDIYKESLDKKVDWGLYQAISSADFHPLGWGSWFMNQLTGGLNLQICHHLFPGIHYRHYPALTKIVYEHMEQAGHKPTYSNTVFEACSRHHQFLKNCSIEFRKLHESESEKKAA